MQDFVCKNADDMHYKVLAERVRDYKENEGGLRSMCRAMEEMRAEAEARGVAIGEARGVAIGEARGRTEGEARGIEKILEALRSSGFDEETLKAAAERAANM